MFDAERNEEFPGQCTAGGRTAGANSKESWKRWECSGAELLRDKALLAGQGIPLYGERKFTVVFTAARLGTNNYCPSTPTSVDSIVIFIKPFAIMS